MMKQRFLVARTVSNRPSLQHLEHDIDGPDWTACGLYVTGWSRAYSDKPIPVILCMKCAKKVAS